MVQDQSLELGSVVIENGNFQWQSVQAAIHNEQQAIINMKIDM